METVCQPKSVHSELVALKERIVSRSSKHLIVWPLAPINRAARIAGRLVRENWKGHACV
jgi:hypothetical protein